MLKETYKVKFLKHESKNGHVNYTIKVIGTKSDDFQICDRYSSMRDYWKNMVSKHQNSVPPNFPRKKWFGNTGEEFIRQRMTDLEHFFNSLLAEPNLAASPITQAYFKQKKVKMNEKKISNNGNTQRNIQSNNGNIKEETKGPPIYVDTTDKLLHEKKWRKVADTITKAYIDINLGDDPPLPEEVKKKAIKYAENINETINTIPYVSKILDLPKRNLTSLEDPTLELIKNEEVTTEWLSEKTQTLIKIINNDESVIYTKEEFLCYTKVKKH